MPTDHYNQDRCKGVHDLSLKKVDDRLELEIKDNGRGFDVQKVLAENPPIGGMGLENMNDRTDLSNGTLQITSEKGKGTTVKAVWPDI